MKRSGELTRPVGDDDHSIGDAAAPVTLVEYGDYECPHCGRAHPIVKAVRARMGKRLRFVFRNFPLTEIHSHAEHAAEAAEAVAVRAGDKAFWTMHDLIFDHQDEGLSDPLLTRLAAKAGADAEEVLADVRAGTYRGRVRDDFMSGVRSGVNGTPTFFINGVRFDGSWDFENLLAALEEAAGR
jgi:protein-disulfide isomerase